MEAEKNAQGEVVYPCLPSLGEHCGSCHRCTDAPEDAPVAVPRHFLVVADEWNEDGGLEVEHSPACPTEQLDDGYEAYICHVRFQEEQSGLDSSFLHRDDPETAHYAERLDPGRYEIEAWSKCYPAGPWGLEEWDGGLRVVTLQKGSYQHDTESER